MTIETKYCIGQDVWLLYDNKAVKQTVNGVYTSTEMKGGQEITNINYDICFCSGSFKENEIHETKEALLQSL